MADDKMRVLKDDRDAADVILSELDRLRATVARLQEELAAAKQQDPRVVVFKRDRWINARDGQRALDMTERGCSALTEDTASAIARPLDHVYRITITAQRVERKTP